MAIAEFIKPKRKRKPAAKKTTKASADAKVAKAKPARKSSGNSRAIKKEVDGIIFDSTMEANYYEYLKAEQLKGSIVRFELQPVFVLLEDHVHPHTGKKVRGIKYISDFVVYYPDGSMLIIDTKGRETPDFKLKRKLFDFLYPELTLQLIIWDPRSSTWVDFDDNKKAKAKARRESKKRAKEKLKGGPLAS